MADSGSQSLQTDGRLVKFFAHLHTGGIIYIVTLSYHEAIILFITHYDKRGAKSAVFWKGFLENEAVVEWIVVKDVVAVCRLVFEDHVAVVIEYVCI